jgi:hypothetical protein
MSTVAVKGAVRRSVIGRIADYAEQAEPGGALHGVEVAAAMPPEPTRRLVYGGVLRWVRRDVLAERNAAHELVMTFDVRVRVVELGDDIAEAELIADRIEDAITDAVHANPPLAGAFGRVVVTSGDADPVVVGLDRDGFTLVTVNRGITVTVTIVAAGV